MTEEKHRGWSKTLIIIHWVTALTVVTLFALGLWMVDLNYYSEWYRKAPDLHRSIGIVLFVLTLFRLIYKAFVPRPKQYGSPAEMRLARLAHLFIYLLLLTIFASGYLISTADGRAIIVFSVLHVPSLGELFANQETLAGDIHYYSAISLIVLSVLHAAAALKHHFINKDQTLLNMLIRREKS